VSAHGGGYVSHYPARMDHAWGARVDPRTSSTEARQSLAKLYFDTIVSTASSCGTGEPVGADHIVVGTDYPYDMAGTIRAASSTAASS